MKELQGIELMEIDGGFHGISIGTGGHWWMYALGILAIAAVMLLQLFLHNNSGRASIFV